MLGICLLLLLNTSGQKNSININEVVAVEDNGQYALIYMTRSGMSLTTKDKYDVVISKIEEAKAACRLENK